MLLIQSSGKKLREKARWGVHIDTACCFEQILEAALHKTAKPTYLACDSRQMRKGSKDKLVSTVLL